MTPLIRAAAAFPSNTAGSGPVGPTDPYYANVVALVQANSGAVIERKGVANFSLAGTTAISSAEKKFGTHSILTTGTTTQNSAGVRMSDAGDYFVFPGQFTFEAWFYPTSIVNFISLFDGQVNYSNISSWTANLNSGGTISVLHSGNTSTGPSSSSPMTTGAWQHFAWTRDASNVATLWLNGVSVASATRGNQIGVATSGLSHLNVSRGIASDNRSFRGYVDQIRITKGVCRYTGTFSVPTEPFPTS